MMRFFRGFIEQQFQEATDLARGLGITGIGIDDQLDAFRHAYLAAKYRITGCRFTNPDRFSLQMLCRWGGDSFLLI